MRGTSYLLVAIVVSCFLVAVPGQDFHLVATQTPPFSGSGQPVDRFSIAGSGGLETILSQIPAAATDDPSSVSFRSPWELVISNRSGHSGNGTVSVFYLDSDYQDFVAGPVISGNQLTDVHQVAFNPVDGELFATNFNSGVMSRFTFDVLGRAVPNGTITMPDSSLQLGVVVRAADQQLFVSSSNFIRRFARGAGGSYAPAGTFVPPGSSGLHYMKFRGDELYVCSLYTHTIYRYTFDAAGAPVANGTVSAQNAIDVAFSPDGQEMFAARHFVGGIWRYAYQAGTDSWLQTGLIAGTTLGGLAVHPGDPTGTSDIYGSGCPAASGTVPTLAAVGATGAGNLVLVRMTHGLPGTTGILLVGVNPLNLPIGTGCTLYVDFIMPSGILYLPMDPAGDVFIPITVPAGFPGLVAYVQYAFAFAGGGGVGVAATNGLKLAL